MKKALLSCLSILLINSCSFFDSAFGDQEEETKGNFTMNGLDTGTKDTETSKETGTETKTEDPVPVNPTSSGESGTKKKYQVNFYRHNNLLIKGVTVEEGQKPNVQIDPPIREDEYNPDLHKEYPLKYIFNGWMDEKTRLYKTTADLPNIYENVNYTANYSYTITGKTIYLYCLDDEYKKTGELRNGPFQQCSPQSYLVSPIDYTNANGKNRRILKYNQKDLKETPGYFKYEYSTNPVTYDSKNDLNGEKYEFVGWSRSIDAKPTDSNLIPHATLREWTYDDFNDGDILYGVFRKAN